MCVCVWTHVRMLVCVHFIVHEVKKVVPGPWGKGQFWERRYEGDGGRETTLLSIKGKQPLHPLLASSRLLTGALSFLMTTRNYCLANYFK